MSKILDHMADLLAKPEAWTQAAYARTETGYSVPSSSRYAACFCLMGAHNRARLDTGSDVKADYKPSIALAAGELFPNRVKYEDDYVGNIAAFNDHSETTHQDVLAVIKRAKDLANAQG